MEARWWGRVTRLIPHTHIHTHMYTHTHKAPSTFTQNYHNKKSVSRHRRYKSQINDLDYCQVKTSGLKGGRERKEKKKIKTQESSATCFWLTPREVATGEMGELPWTHAPRRRPYLTVPWKIDSAWHEEAGCRDSSSSSCCCGSWPWFCADRPAESQSSTLLAAQRRTREKKDTRDEGNETRKRRRKWREKRGRRTSKALLESCFFSPERKRLFS